MKKMIEFIIVAVFVYAALLAFMYFNQRNMIYFPDTSRPDPASYGASNVEIAEVETEDGLSLQGWYFAPPVPGRPVIVHFHGNAANIANRLPKIAPYLENGYGVLLAEYRGYGGNPGAPAEEGLYRDARAYLGWLKKEKGFPLSRTVFYGESLGAAVAVRMAAETDPAAVILEAPFTSAVGLARKMYFFVPVDWLMRDRYENKSKIGAIGAPLLVIAGEADSIVPPENSRALFEAAPEPRYYVSLPGAGHNDMEKHGLSGEVLKFLSTLDFSVQNNGR